MQIINRLGHASKRTRVFLSFRKRKHSDSYLYIYIYFLKESCVETDRFVFVVNNPKQQQL